MATMTQPASAAKTAHALAAEFEAEAATTRRILERVPNDQLEWRPKPKSMSLGQLARHIATVPEGITGAAKPDEFDGSNVNFDVPQPKDMAEVLAEFEAGKVIALDYLRSLTDAQLEANWRMVRGGKTIFAMSRHQFLRGIMFSHLFHHRGQLSVYLRLLDVPVPSIYGPSADENPFVG